MCGIFGWQFRPNYRPGYKTRLILATSLAARNLSRGKDSWGYYDTTNNHMSHGLGEFTAAGAARMALSFSAFGHTRQATVGDKTIQNAHPFLIGNIVGAHNGGVSNHDALNKIRKDANLPAYTCDSMSILSAVNDGLETMDKVNAWGSLEWLDLRDHGAIKLCKLFSHSALEIMLTRNGIIWSSEEEALKNACRDAGLKGILLKADEHIVYSVHNGNIFTTEDRIHTGTTYAGNQGSMGFQQTSYGSRFAGSGMEDTARSVQETFQANKKGKGRRKQGSQVSIIDPNKGKPFTDGSDMLALCKDCYQEAGADGMCPNRHDKAHLVIVK